MRKYRDWEEEALHEKWMQKACDEDLEETITDYTEEGGFGEWIEDRDPKAPDVYCVRGTAVKDGEKVTFEDKAEYCFRAVNCKAGAATIVDVFGREWDAGSVETEYDIEGYWDNYYLEKEGYKDIKVLAWKQDES